MSFFKDFKSKFKIIILHADTYEEKGRFHTSKMNVTVFILLAVLLIIAATTSLIFFTSIRELIPGYTDVTLDRRVYKIERASDSIETVLRQKDLYIENLRRLIFEEEMADDSLEAVASVNKGVKPVPKLLDEKSERDSLFRVRYEAEMMKNLISTVDSEGEESLPSFVSPCEGTIASRFDAGSKHFGIDIVSPSKTAVTAVADGVIILSELTDEKDYIIVVQHNNNVISIYRHNTSLLHYEGDNVNAGDAIAIVGGVNDQPKGAHLHLELWLKGEPVNPENYISFGEK